MATARPDTGAIPGAPARPGPAETDWGPGRHRSRLTWCAMERVRVTRAIFHVQPAALAAAAAAAAVELFTELFTARLAARSAPTATTDDELGTRIFSVSSDASSREYTAY